MDIHGQRPDARRALQQRVDEALADAARRARERNRATTRPEARETASRVEQARVEAHRLKQHRIANADSERSADRIELSHGARAATRADEARAATDPGHLAKLRALIAEGGLFTPERIEQAARRLLAGE